MTTKTESTKLLPLPELNASYHTSGMPMVSVDRAKKYATNYALANLQSITTASTPDFDAVEDKRLSELTPAQREDATELWLRKNLGWFDTNSHVAFLLKRLDAARNAVVGKEAQVIAWKYVSGERRETIAIQEEVITELQAKNAELLKVLKPLADCDLPPPGYEHLGVTVHFPTGTFVAAKKACNS